jgi:predicted DNA-binding transcriptional regulator YafY
MTGDSISFATLHMSLRAYLLMREEHPLCIAYIEKTDDGYVFHGPFSNFEGITRFILGLIDEIRIVQPSSLKDFVRRKIESQKL